MPGLIDRIVQAVEAASQRQIAIAERNVSATENVVDATENVSRTIGSSLSGLPDRLNRISQRTTGNRLL